MVTATAGKNGEFCVILGHILPELLAY